VSVTSSAWCRSQVIRLALPSPADDDAGPRATRSTWPSRLPVGSDVTEPALTEELITAAMAKADRRVCVGSDRCFALPHRLEDARAGCTAKGRCKVGWIVSKGGRESWDVWLEVSTGLVKLIAQAGARVDDACPVVLGAARDQGPLAGLDLCRPGSLA
jgi:hypothetical protein